MTDTARGGTAVRHTTKANPTEAIGRGAGRARVLRSAPLAFAVAALALLAFASAASADFQTRPQIASFGPQGPGSCAGDAQVTGTGDIVTAAGSGDLSILATGKGTLTKGSTLVTNFSTTTGTFTVGEPIANGSASLDITPGTTIAAVDSGAGTLTLSAPATRSTTGISGTESLISGSRTLTNVSTSAGTFVPGMAITSIGSGVLSGTTIVAVDSGAGTLTLSAGVTQSASRNLRAGWMTDVSADCGAFQMGQALNGAGVARNSTISAIDSGAGTITPSSVPDTPGAGVALSAFLPFRSVQSLAFDQANRRLYVLDGGDPSTIYAYDAATPGAYTQLNAGNGHPGFPLTGIAGSDSSSDIAVDNSGLASAGRLYYTGCTLFGGIFGGCTEYKLFAFDPGGSELNAGNGHPNFPLVVASNAIAGIGVDPSGNIWISRTVSGAQYRFDRYDSGGSPLAPVSTPQLGPQDVAFDSNADVYFADGSGIRRYTAAGGYAPANQIVGAANQVAVDRSTHGFYAIRNSFLDFFTYAFDSAAAQLYAFGGQNTDGLEANQDVGIDQVADTAFLATSREVRAFGPPQILPDPAATVQAATSVGQTTARLNGLVDDGSAVPTPWRFEISDDDGATWTVSGGGFSAPANLTRPSHTTLGGQSGFPVSVTATGLQANTTYRFRLVVRKNPATAAIPSAELTFTTDPIDPAIVTPAVPANVTTTTADLTATIDDNGPLPTNWQLQTSPDGVAWTTAESGTTAGETSDTVVAGIAVGLNPNTSYQYRVLTDKGPGSVAETTPGPGFTTDVAPPTISAVGAYAIRDTSARLVAAVNPNALESTYQFHYGTSSDSLDTPVPASPASLGAGSDPVAVSQELTGLSPDTDYYFQLSADNATGSGASPVQSFHTRALPLPNPDSRAYEQVSPVEKNFGVLGSQKNPSPVAVAWDGDAAAFKSSTPFGGGQIQFIATTHLSQRAADGWRTRWPYANYCVIDNGDNPGTRSTQVSLSPNLGRGVIQRPESVDCPIAPLSPSAPLPQKNLYRADYGTDPTDYQLLAPAFGATPHPDSDDPSATFAAASDDYSHVVYRSTGQQTADAPVGDFDKLFEWDDGTLNLVSRDTAGEPLTSASGVPSDAVNGVSADGSRVFFQSPVAGDGSCAAIDCELYLRADGATRWVSEQECSPACPDAGAPDTFEWASPDGEKAFFLSSAQHTDDDTSTTGSDLYRYVDSANPAGDQNLTLVSEDSEAADGDFAGVGGMLGTSDDGETIYFVAGGQLVAGGPIGGGPKLYRWQSGGGSPTLEYLAMLASADSGNWNASSKGTPEVRAVTPSGAHLLVQSAAPLKPGIDRDGDIDVYRWSEGDGWQCLSCQSPGQASVGDSTFSGGFFEVSRELRGTMSDDGRRVFFISNDALSPADTNGVGGCPPVFLDNNDGSPSSNVFGYRCQDVYEWHDGALNLISTGLATEPVFFGGAGRTGRDVFFLTRERLVGWDTDNAYDLYDARIGGGFPEPPAEPPLCEGEGCRGEGTDSPAPAGPGSAAFQGAGNPVAAPPGPRRCGRLARGAQRKARAAKRLRRRARRAGNPKAAKRLRLRSRRFAVGAKRNAKQAKRCRRAYRRAGR